MAKITTSTRVRDSNNNVVETFSRPLDKYEIANREEGTTSYYGYIDKDGNWYIMKSTSTVDTFVKGITDYATNWTGRAGLTYQRFDLVF